MATPKNELGAMSAIRLNEDGERFVTVMDPASGPTGRLLRDKDGRLAGISDFAITEMGRPMAGRMRNTRWMPRGWC